MPNLETADEILAIPVSEAERLFGTPEQIGPVFREAALRWHPDHGGRQDVFAHLLALRAEADRKSAAGAWVVPGRLEIGGRRIRFFHRFTFELGTAYLGNNVLAYVVEPEFADLAKRAEAVIKGLNFADAAMRAEMAPRLPRLLAAFDGQPGQRVLVLEKPAGIIRLSDLLTHEGGRIPARHVAWIISELLNFACYLNAYRGIIHLGLAPETVFIAPATHQVLPLGGWFYATRRDAYLATLPERTDHLLPMTARQAECAVPSIDLELIRAIGREALGDAAGTRLRLDPDVPTALADWLRRPSGHDPVAEYRLWPGTILDSFGARRFAELLVTASDVYGKEADNG
jgi:hypothetical protein